jgi:hypothetical protein
VLRYRLLSGRVQADGWQRGRWWKDGAGTSSEPIPARVVVYGSRDARGQRERGGRLPRRHAPTPPDGLRPVGLLLLLLRVVLLIWVGLLLVVVVEKGSWRRKTGRSMGRVGDLLVRIGRKVGCRTWRWERRSWFREVVIRLLTRSVRSVPAHGEVWEWLVVRPELRKGGRKGKPGRKRHGWRVDRKGLYSFELVQRGSKDRSWSLSDRSPLVTSRSSNKLTRHELTAV